MEHKEKQSIKIWHFTLMGVLFGICFPLIAFMLVLQEHGLPMSFANIKTIHKNHLVLYITDLAPLVIGICFSIIGKYMQRQLDYLVSLADLERNLRHQNYNSDQKLSLRNIRKTYVFVFSSVGIMIVIGLICVMERQENEISRSSLMMEISQLNDVITSSENLSKANFEEIDGLYHKAHNLGYVQGNEALYKKVVLVTNANPKSMSSVLLAVYILDNIQTDILIQSAAKARHLSFICGIIVLLSLSIFAYTHFFIFTPNFISAQRAIYENTLARHTIRQQAEELQIANEERKESLEQLNSNLQMALRVQNIIEGANSKNDSQQSSWFYINKPMQVLSGDFMWHRQLDMYRSLWFLGDSVGHGVAGHLQANLYKTLLDKISNNTNNPIEILAQLHEQIVSLPQDGNDLSCEGGMMLIDTAKGNIEFAGAGIAAMLVNGDEVKTLKAQKFVVGGRHINQPMELQKETLSPKGWLMMTSDGLRNAISKNQKRLGEKGLINMLEKNFTPYGEKFKVQLESAIDIHLQETAQHDDISILALKPITIN